MANIEVNMMRYRGTLDPDCPGVKGFLSLLDEPMTRATAALINYVCEDFKKGHRKTCRRCQEFTAANHVTSDP